jgi:hypothetical protein
MRVALVIGLALLAGVAGYGLSQLRDSKGLEAVSRSAAVAAAPASDPLGLAEAPKNESATDAKATSQSFEHERPNVATMAANTFGLPPESMPLAQAKDDLVAAMRAGSVAAVRRLLEQTKACEIFRDANTGLEFALSAQEAAKSPGENGVFISMAPKGDEPPLTLTGMVNSSATAVAVNEARCAGFEDPDDALRFEAQWRAALMGELDGLLEFSLNPAIDVGRAFEQVDRIERYRARVLDFMNQAMTQHSTQAVANLMHAYDPGWVPEQLRGSQGSSSPMSAFIASQTRPEPLRQVAGTDPVLAYRYARLCQTVCPEFPRSAADAIVHRLREDLESADRERAEAAADRLRAEHFSGPARAPWIADIGEQPETVSVPGKP